MAGVFESASFSPRAGREPKPTPGTGFGTVTHYLMPNPAWRWWAFWRPRAFAGELPRVVRLGPGIELPVMVPTAEAQDVLKGDLR